MDYTAKIRGGIPLYKLYRNMLPHRLGFLRLFDLKTGIIILSILVWNLVLFSRELRKCMNVFYFIVSIPNE